jgi:hypothetical protein
VNFIRNFRGGRAKDLSAPPECVPKKQCSPKYGLYVKELHVLCKTLFVVRALNPNDAYTGKAVLFRWDEK